jgi:hypothetical protein
VPGRSFGAHARLKPVLSPSASTRTSFRRASVLVAAVRDVEMRSVQTADKAHQLVASVVSTANSTTKTIYIPQTQRPSSSRPRSGPGSATPSSSAVRGARSSRAPAHTRAPAVTYGNHSVTQSTFAAPCVPAHLTNVTMNGFETQRHPSRRHRADELPLRVAPHRHERRLGRVQSPDSSDSPNVATSPRVLGAPRCARGRA